MSTPGEQGLYREAYEKDSCGFGLIANLDDEPSHWLVKTAIASLNRLTHRGAIAADGKTGDGCGLLLKKPEKFLRAVAGDAGIKLTQLFAAGNVFLSPDAAMAARARDELAAQLQAEGLLLAGWRVLPTNPAVCGAEALKTLPVIEQLFVNAPGDMEAAEFNRKLFMTRRRAEKQLAGDPVFYLPSLSAATIVYKGMVMPTHLAEFFPDLADPRVEASVALFHQRFSTNTLPQWRLAHPYRMLAHNGEINTVEANRNWAVARGSVLKTPLLPDLTAILPLVSLHGSDSQSLDNMLEVLVMGGLDVLHALRLLVPPAWGSVDAIDPDLRAYYEFYGAHMEPWDGPAGLVITDGRYAVCTMDRNGLRPARYVITRNRHLTIASEIGVWDYKPEDVVRKGRMGPGQMLALDLSTGTLLENQDIDALLKERHPYKAWLKKGISHLHADLVDPSLAAEPFDRETLAVYQKMYNLTAEERDEVVKVLARDESEAVGSMGDDTPTPVLSHHLRNLYDYFRQQFAQVTNPPIDPLRESIVMSLQTQIGPGCNVFQPAPEHAQQIVLNSPVLSQRELRELMGMADEGVTNAFIDLQYDPAEGLEQAIRRICAEAEGHVRDGKLILLVSDRYLVKGKVPVHALLATGAIHHHLVRQGLRFKCNLVIETGTARDPHHFACLIGYGATAVYPYLAYQTLYDIMRKGGVKAEHADERAQLGKSFRKAIGKGLFKIMSKMGISTIASYRSGQLFEIVGLSSEVVDLCFHGTTSRIEGSIFADLQQDSEYTATRAWNNMRSIEPGGLLKFMYGGEYHMYNPDVIATLQAAVMSGSYDTYKQFAALVNERPASTLRDLLALVPAGGPVPLAEVESVESIMKRFDCAGMSLGALSPEAHEALAIAMNRLGGRSNSGEGGEDPVRYGTEKNSKIKQVASGRFGVTPHYLVNAEVLQIKVAQGAKPGEGGQLPGDKVNDMIAKLRYARPGVGLISPPPHHDIYSIEDLAQLIFDLKQVNPQALVSVKLVSEPGVGTIAAGVAKCYADLITISGYDGGTGASPITSIKYAGSPWELGLAETHQTLRRNAMRDKVRLQTDGGLKTGLDVIKAAIIGAESFGFGTAPMVAIGCKYLRICHLNNCATGVATQHNVLRSKYFIGLPEMVINYFRFVAEECRELLASLGVRSVAELIGQVRYLEAAEGQTPRQKRLNLSSLITDAGVPENVPQYCVTPSNPPFDKGLLAEQMVKDMSAAIQNGSGGEWSYEVKNFNRSIGARVSGEIARRWGNYGMSEKPLVVKLSGSAGQSFGVWNAGGLHLCLEGDANDYVGKGMAGGKITIRPPRTATYVAKDSAIIGNTCLYGATGGELYAAGLAGERFAVRNSGATTVVEGAGDHCCEYMTGGVVCVLGRTGVNFGAGFTGGFAYVLDMERDFVDRYNHELIDIHRLTQEGMEAHIQHLHGLIEKHVAETGSVWGEEILRDFRTYLASFWVVKPKAASIADLIEHLRSAA